MSPCPSSARGLLGCQYPGFLKSQRVYTRKLAIMLQLILKLGELRNNALAFGLLFRVFGLANCLVQIVNGTCLLILLVRSH